MIIFSGEKAKKFFQDVGHGSHLEFLIKTILAIFDLQVTLIHPTSIGINWPFSSGEEAKIRFSRWPSWRPSWISDWNNFSYFWSTSPHPLCFLPSFKSIGLLAQEKKRKKIFKMATMAPSWISNRNYFSYFWSTSHPNASYQVLIGFPLGCRRSRL